MKIGKIISISFNQFRVKVSSEIRGNSVNLHGTVYYFGNIGSYLKTNNAIGEQLICEVISIFDNDSQQNSYDVEGSRELLLKPIGTINRENKFSLGVGIFPSIYSEVNIVTFSDMELILDNPNPDGAKLPIIHNSFYLGQSKNLINYDIHINIDNFFNIHSAILGNSGSGKSNTIAHILQEIHKKNEHSAIGSRILMFDVNGEYKNAFTKHECSDELCIKYLKPNIDTSLDGYKRFLLPHFLLDIDEWCAFLIATEATQRPFWDRVLQESYKFYKIATTDGVSRKKFIAYLRYKVTFILNTLVSQGNTDTSLITAARNVIYGIWNLIAGDEKLSEVCKQEGLITDLDELFKSCSISYGSNENRLKNVLTKIDEKVDLGIVREIANLRIKSGEYFDWKFLREATSMCLLEEDARGNGRVREYTSTMMTRLDYFLDNDECKFMRDRPTNNIVDEKTYLEWLWNFGDNTQDKTQMIIIDTSELSRDSLETLTSVLSRLHFSQRKKLLGDDRRKKPIHLVLDEAHRYINKSTKYILRENIFEKIAREGRKYSLYLIISSQRPSELSDTVLSQCSNFIIHRIQNEVDMKYIYSILPYFSDDFANKIKQSIPGEAIIFGNCVSMPLHVKINKALPEPNSANCNIPEEWFIETTATLADNTPPFDDDIPF